MEDKGKIISTCDIDDNLALQIWTRGHTPRLSIYNKVKNARKLIHIAWVEKLDRTLTISGKKPGENITYTVKDFVPAISKILTEFYAKTNFKLKFLKLVVDLEKALNRPEIANTKADIAMMGEEKRSALWIADCTGGDRNSGLFRPFFPLSEREAQIATEDSLRITEAAMKTAEGLIKTGVPAALKEANPERWHNTVRVVAAAMLLGFSYCGGDGTKMAEEIWAEGEKKAPTQLGQVAMKAPVRKFSLNDPGLVRLGHKLTAYIRHCYYIDDLDIEYVGDSTKELQDADFARSRRIDFNTGTLGDVPYRVTFYENPDEGLTAFGCVPRMQTARHTGDMVLIIPTATYKQALANNSMGNAEDDFFTITRLLWAKQFKAWFETLKPYVGKFAGLIQS
ncbi:MAG: hypothetical protein IJU26_02760 [Synergistaceae bacterium]|nr:hypothetical protein [Synergistaceae bacterium]